MSQFKELLVFGTGRFFDTVYAKKFVGEFEGTIQGNAETATRADQDMLGQSISGTYLKGITGDGTSTTITFTKGDGTTGTFQTKDTVTTIIDNLTTQTANEALSANQGYVIDGRLDTVEAAVAVGSF